MKKITVSKAIGEALHEEMLRDDKVFIMGEDMAVMGNVFAITKGFLEEFGPKRVIDTPISEEGFVGMAVGAAMRGMRHLQRQHLPRRHLPHLPYPLRLPWRTASASASPRSRARRRRSWA